MARDSSDSEDLLATKVKRARKLRKKRTKGAKTTTSKASNTRTLKKERLKTAPTGLCGYRLFEKAKSKPKWHCGFGTTPGINLCSPKKNSKGRQICSFNRKNARSISGLAKQLSNDLRAKKMQWATQSGSDEISKATMGVLNRHPLEFAFKGR